MLITSLPSMIKYKQWTDRSDFRKCSIYNKVHFSKVNCDPYLSKFHLFPAYLTKIRMICSFRLLYSISYFNNKKGDQLSFGENRNCECTVNTQVRQAKLRQVV